MTSCYLMACLILKYITAPGWSLMLLMDARNSTFCTPKNMTNRKKLQWAFVQKVEHDLIVVVDASIACCCGLKNQARLIARKQRLDLASSSEAKRRNLGFAFKEFATQRGNFLIFVSSIQHLPWTIWPFQYHSLSTN
jgi:hypothetical protein